MKITKNLIRKAVGIAVVLPLLFSCEKEDDFVQSEDAFIASNLELTINPEIHSLQFPTTNGLLVFRDLDELKETVIFLEKEVDAYDDTFLEMYGQLDPEALEAKEEEIRFDQYEPLTVFAENNNLNSLFDRQVLAEEDWLSQSELDITTDPDNHFVEDKGLQAILNEQSEVMAGRAIYKMMDFGYVIILDGDFNTLNQIRTNPEMLDYSNVEVVGDQDTTRAAGCNSGKGKSGLKPVGSFRIKWKISHRTPITGRRVKCTTINYKKKKKKGWKKTRSYTLVKPYGNISDSKGRCDKAIDFNPDNLYSDRYNKISWSWKVDVATKTKSGWVKGYHIGAGGITHTSTLTW